METLPTYLCVFIDNNDHIDLSITFTPEFLTKEEMTRVLNEVKEYKKDLLESYTNDTYNKEDVETILTIRDKISLISNVIKDYDKLKQEFVDTKNLINKVDNYNNIVESYLSKTN